MLQNQRVLPKVFPLLERFIQKDTDWHSLGQRRGQGSGRDGGVGAYFKKLFARATLAAPSPAAENVQTKVAASSPTIETVPNS